jgi:uncharacterized protein YndB with AHSA1/START domain
MQLDGCTAAYDRTRQTATSELHVSEAVRRSIVVPSDVADVWAALTDRERLRLWFGAEVELDARAGGLVRATWPDGSRSLGSVDLADERSRLVFRWRRIAGSGLASRDAGATRVSFELAPVEGGTCLSVTEEPVELAGLAVAP